VSEQQTCDVVISAHYNPDSDKVSADELRLISAFFPEILKEMMQHVDFDKE
jgi:hypothetical protein